MSRKRSSEKGSCVCLCRFDTAAAWSARSRVEIMKRILHGECVCLFFRAFCRDRERLNGFTKHNCSLRCELRWAKSLVRCWLFFTGKSQRAVLVFSESAGATAALQVRTVTAVWYHARIIPIPHLCSFLPNREKNQRTDCCALLFGRALKRSRSQILLAKRCAKTPTCAKLSCGQKGSLLLVVGPSVTSHNSSLVG